MGDNTDSRRRALRATLAICAVALSLALFASAASAAATYEGVGCFAGSLPGLSESCKPVAEEKFGEEVELGGVGGLAVNRTGAGGVPKGTVYAATWGQNSETPGLRISEYRPVEGGLEFALSWEVRSVEGVYERCGPKAEEPLHEHCLARVGGGDNDIDVDVDQATGNVYAFNGQGGGAGVLTIAEFDPNGEEVLARFGELAPGGGVTTAETPEKVHGSSAGGEMAVNDAGEVFVFDLNSFDDFYHRLMVFRPKIPGVYSEYEYAGEIDAGFLNEGKFPNKPIFDEAGNLYTATEETVEELAPQSPEPYPAAHPAPACSFTYPKSGITAMTVDPASGEPFFTSYKKEKGFAHKLLRQLGPCEGGEFHETAKTEVLPERADLSALAFDPTRKLEAARPAGVLYGAAPGPVPEIGTGEPGQSSLGYVFALPKLQESPPKVETESVAQVTPKTAQLRAQIDPEGFATAYRFQYLTRAEYEEAGESFEGARDAPMGGASLGSGKAPLAAAVSVSGLSPGTEYRYRAVAESECAPAEEGRVCVVPGAAQGFRTFPAEAPGLPDGRVYELVSPAQKNGGEVLPAQPKLNSCIPKECKPGDTYQHFPMQSAPDGNSVLYEGTPFGSEGAVIENAYIARRTGSGWQTSNLTPPLLGSGSQQGYKAFAAGLGEGVIEQLSPALGGGAPTEYPNLYRQPSGDPLALQALIDEGNATLHCAPRDEGSQIGLRLSYAGASRDFSRQFFAANDALTPEAAGACGEVNLYEWAGGELRAVNVLPGEAESAPGAALGSGVLLENGNVNNGFTPLFEHAISADGGRVFWTAITGALYVRVDGTETVEVPGPGNCLKSAPRAQRACFLTASADGSEVLLSNGVLYDLNEETGAYEEALDLTQGQGGFLGIVGQAEENLSHLYFVDTEVLAGENAAHQAPAAGKDNLYALDEGASAFIATLSGKQDGQDWAAVPTLRMGEASPDGRWLAFLSQAELTGYDNVGPCAGNEEVGKIEQGPCLEAFLYDSATKQLRCASCNPTGERPVGQSVLRLIFEAPPTTGQPRYLTNSGRLYFDSRDSLVAADTNEGAEDVYEYEPEGVGGCASEFAEGGCASLISSGREDLDSNLLAIDETGANVFFTTRQRLLAKDTDELIDLYDAREGGGIAAETETQRAECQGEACQPSSNPPANPTPGSSSFQGAGNEAKPPKKAQKHKHKRHRRHHKRKRYARTANADRRAHR